MIVDAYKNTELPIQHDVSLNTEQREIFMETIQNSLRISHRSQLFNWLQGGIQCLVDHEVMIFGIKTSDSDSYEFEYFTSTRYFDDTKFKEAVYEQESVVNQAIALWKKTSTPIFVTNQLKLGQQKSGELLFEDYDKFSIISHADTELNSFVVHGFGDRHSKTSTVVIFARLKKQINAYYAHVIELLMPHLHCVLIKVTSTRSNIIISSAKVTKTITKRESEVLHWVHLGKTNWEISSIMDLSPLTIKNHVQNILRKLDVQNRGQAAIKAAKMGLVSNK